MELGAPSVARRTEGQPEGTRGGLASEHGPLNAADNQQGSGWTQTERQSPFTLTGQLADAAPTQFSALQTYSPRSNFVVLLSCNVATPAVKSREQRSDWRSFLPALNQATEISGVPSTRHLSNNASPSFISTGSIVSTKDGRSGLDDHHDDEDEKLVSQVKSHQHVSK